MNILKDKEFLKKLLIIGLPIALQNLIMSSMNIIDVFMVGQLGEVSIAALGLANQIFFLIVLMLFGINSGSSVFIAQFWGKRNISKIKETLGIAISLGIIVTAFSFLGVQYYGKILLRVYTKDLEVINQGYGYLKIVSWSYIFTSIAFAFSIALRSIERTKIPMYTSLVSLLINATLNYIFIFGKFGFPAMGVRGAALATLIARTIECFVIISITYARKFPLAGRLKELFTFDFTLFKRFFKTSFPIMVHELFWALGITTYNIVYARIGTASLAAINIEGSIERIAFVLFIGIGNAAGIMIGNEIGKGNKERAFDYAKKSIIIGPFLSIFISTMLIFSSGYILKIYDVSEQVYNYSRILLIIFSIYMPFKVFNMTNIVGILRSGGDTKYGLFLELGGIWLIGVPLALITGLVLDLSIYYVYIFANLEEIFKMIFGLKRLISKKWLNNLVENV
ncbi:MAG: MATE family efflux transporter [Fusobacteriota bacterium]